MSDKLYQALNITQNDFDFIYNKVIDKNYLGFKNLSIQQFKKILETIVELDKLEQKKTAMTDKNLKIITIIENARQDLETLKTQFFKLEDKHNWYLTTNVLEELYAIQELIIVANLENELDNTEPYKKMEDNIDLKQSDPIVEQVIDKFKSRSQEGIKKYDTTLADNKLTQEEWLTHLQEELMDAVVYLEKIKNEYR